MIGIALGFCCAQIQQPSQLPTDDRRTREEAILGYEDIRFTLAVRIMPVGKGAEEALENVPRLGRLARQGEILKIRSSTVRLKS